jgi:hypothetical protein
VAEDRWNIGTPSYERVFNDDNRFPLFARLGPAADPAMSFSTEDLLRSYPRERPELPAVFRAAISEYYVINREGKSATTSISQKLESWMHRKVAADVVGQGKPPSTLEIGAGTLNHLRYEPAQQEYDIVEPYRDFFVGSARLSRIRTVYSDIREVSRRRYGRITSIATFEHLTELPFVVAKAVELLDNEKGRLRVGIPNEGTVMWRLGTAVTGMEFRRRYGLDYQVFHRHEHVNTAHDVEAVLRYFFGEVRCSVFGLSRRLAFYRFYDCAKPNGARASAYLAGYQNASIGDRK